MDAAKRETILEAAARAFATFGFKKASVDAIARAAGVAKGTVYLCCDSKADLFYQSVHRELRAWLALGARQIDPRKPADELLKTTAIQGIQFLESRPLVRDLFFGLHQGQIPDWRIRFDELRELGRGNVTELLRLGQRQGLFRKELNVEGLAGVLQDMHIAGYMFNCNRTDRSLTSLLEDFELSFDLVLNGLYRRDGGTP